MNDHWAALPSVTAFVERLIEDIEDQRSLIVISPDDSVGETLRNRIDSALWTREFDIERVDVTELHPNESVATRLASVLGLSDKTSPHLVEDLLAYDNAPDLVFLEGFEEATPSVRSAWLKFLTRYASLSQGLIMPSGQRLCVYVLMVTSRSLPSVPETDVRLSVRWWWGFPSTTEIQLFCRTLVDGNIGSPSNKWRETVIASLALNDFRLAEYLCPKTPCEHHQLFDLLIAYAKERQWSREELDEAGAQDVDFCAVDGDDAPSECPPRTLYDLYRMGAVCFTPEMGIELHSAAAALLGREDILRHRIWRAQCQTLLPAIDAARLNICQRLTDRYGPSWPLRWRSPVDEQETAAVSRDPNAAGIGHINTLVMNEPALKREQHWLPFLNKLRSARNGLAHYQLISFADFKNLLSAARRFRRG